MIDESILDEIIPVPDADTKMQELKEELAAEGVSARVLDMFTIKPLDA